MTREEIARFRWTLLSMFRRAESTFIQTELGTLESESWAGIKGTLQLGLATRQGAIWWPRRRELVGPSPGIRRPLRRSPRPDAPKRAARSTHGEQPPLTTV